MKNNWRVVFLTASLSMMSLTSFSQEFIPIWQNEKMPNSRGIGLKDSIANERIYQVATPGFYMFRPSDAENKKAAVVIIPGGGYARLAYIISGFQLAKWFNTFGVTAFVLNHRLPQSPDVIESYKAPLQDAQRAIKHIRHNSKEWGIDTNKIGVFGSSAGGHLATSLSVIQDDWAKNGGLMDATPHRPNFTMLISPVITMDKEYVHKGSRENLLGKSPSQELLNQFSSEKRVDTTTPPAFMVHASDDKSVPAMNSILYYGALYEKGITQSSLHIFPSGEHSIALRNNPEMTDSWSVLAEKWLSEIGIVE